MILHTQSHLIIAILMGYSGDFGSTGVIKPGEIYEFLFTEAPPNIPVTIEYHCDPHPWMTWNGCSITG